MRKALLIVSILLLSGCSTYEDGLNEGYDEGYDEGYSQGYDEGYNQGHEEGYDEGYGMVDEICSGYATCADYW